MRPDPVDNSFEERRRRRHETRVALGIEEPTLEEKLADVERRADAGDPDAVELREEIHAILDEIAAKVAVAAEQANRLH